MRIKSVFGSELVEVHVGMLVAWQSDDRVQPEYGTVTVVNPSGDIVFVRFFGDYHGKACQAYGLTAG